MEGERLRDRKTQTEGDIKKERLTDRTRHRQRETRQIVSFSQEHLFLVLVLFKAVKTEEMQVYGTSR